MKFAILSRTRNNIEHKECQRYLIKENKEINAWQCKLSENGTNVESIVLLYKVNSPKIGLKSLYTEDLRISENP